MTMRIVAVEGGEGKVARDRMPQDPTLQEADHISP